MAFTILNDYSVILYAYLLHWTDPNNFKVCHPEVFNTIQIYNEVSVKHKKKNFIMFIILLEQHVSILIESSSGPSKKQVLS